MKYYEESETANQMGCTYREGREDDRRMKE
jgi:hypothetical protein